MRKSEEIDWQKPIVREMKESKGFNPATDGYLVTTCKRELAIKERGDYLERAKRIASSITETRSPSFKSSGLDTST